MTTIVDLSLFCRSTGFYRDVMAVQDGIEQPIDNAHLTVDDLPTGPDGDDSYVQFVAGDGSRVTFGFLPPSTIGAANIASIDRLEIYINARRTPAGAGTPKYRPFVYNNFTGGIADFSSIIQPTTSYATTVHTVTTNPLTGLAWAVEDFEHQRIELGVTRVPVSGQPAIRVSQFYALLWYNPLEWTIQIKPTGEWSSVANGSGAWISMEAPSGSWTKS